MPEMFDDAIEVLKGPRGGEIVSPNQPWQEKEFNPQETESGTLGLHRFNNGYHRTTSPPLKNEQPWHRMAAFMLLHGHTNKEISATAGVTESTVSILRAQRWFQELLATLQNDAGAAVQGLLESEALASLETIVEIRDDKNASQRNRMAAAVTLLEHYKGKPHQTVTTEVRKPVRSPEERMAELLQDLDNLNKVASTFQNQTEKPQN